MTTQTESISLSRSDMQRMLDLTYELEGLLQLAINREDDAPARLTVLMDAKLKSLSSIISPSAHAEPVADPEVAPSSPAEAPTIPEAAEPSTVAPAPDDEDFSYSIPDDDDDEEIVENQTTEEVVKDAPQQPESIEADVESVASEQVDAGYAAPDNYAAPEGYSVPEPEKAAPAGSERRENIATAPSASRQGAPVFSINDRFLFSRELFGGSVADFERALKDVAGMESYEEAEEYFCTEWKFDPEAPTVIEFFAVITRFFDR